MPEPTAIEVLSPGLFSTVQDLGRMGQQHLGVPVGGAMDRLAARKANFLVGNPASTPVIEMTLKGPRLRFHQDLWVATVGCQNASGTLSDDRPRLARAGEEWTIQLNPRVCRAYLAIAGKWLLPEWLGSKSAFWVGARYFPEGARLLAGQKIPVQGKPLEPPRPWLRAGKSNPSKAIRLLPGPEWGQFPLSAQHQFLQQKWTVASQSNRMALQLKENLILNSTIPEMISAPVWPGTIQCTRSGQLMILMFDAQTTGGYPRIGQVLEADLDRLAQCRPGAPISLVLVQAAQAELIDQAYRSQLSQWTLPEK